MTQLYDSVGLVIVAPILLEVVGYEEQGSGERRLGEVSQEK